MNCCNSTGSSEVIGELHRNQGTNRRTWLAAAAATPLLSGCFWPRFFELDWDEEVQLHDGRVILVKLKYTYERLGSSFKRYIPSILRATEISFDAGESIGRFTQVFQKHRIDIVEQVNGKWYLLLEQVGGLLAVQTSSGWVEAWGSAENSSGHKCWSLDENGFVQASLNDLPDSALKVNVLIGVPAEQLSVFDSQRVTLMQKKDYLQMYPLNPSEYRIERPSKNSSQPK